MDAPRAVGLFGQPKESAASDKARHAFDLVAEQLAGTLVDALLLVLLALVDARRAGGLREHGNGEECEDAECDEFHVIPLFRLVDGFKLRPSNAPIRLARDSML